MAIAGLNVTELVELALKKSRSGRRIERPVYVAGLRHIGRPCFRWRARKDAEIFADLFSSEIDYIFCGL